MSIFGSISAYWFWPLACRPVMTWALVAPAGSCLLMMPWNNRLVARPRILGPTIVKETLTIAITMMSTSM